MKRLEQIIDQKNLQYIDKLSLKDQSVYTGYVDHDKEPETWGCAVWPDGARYEGEWQDG